MTEIEELKARIKKLEDAKEHLLRLIAKFFEPPCQYEYGDLDAYEFMNDIDPETGVEWCEENCGKVSCYDCWVRFFKIIAEAEKEQLEYGKDERS